MATSPRPGSPVPQAAPQGVLIAVLLTLITLVPLFSVIGLVVSMKTGADRSLCILVGAAVGGLFALRKATH